MLTVFHTEIPDLMTEIEIKRSRSAYRCPRCGLPPSNSSQKVLMVARSVHCQGCREVYSCRNAKTLVLRGSQRFLDLDEVRKATWFHKTIQPDWPNQPISHPDTPMVHIGTYQAACQADVLPATTYLYRVKVQDTAEIADFFLTDNCFWEKSITQYEHQAYRYVNRYESPGSISLIIDPNHIEVVRRTSV